jgi:hypothetical protein
MDNPTHHHPQVVQLNNTNPQNVNNKSSGEPDNFLTVRLLMQGKVSCIFSYYCNHLLVYRKSVVSLENVVII